VCVKLILKGNGIAWFGRRLIRSLYMDQSVKAWQDKGETRNMKIARGVRQGYCLSPILFNLYSEYLTKEAFEGFGYSKM
jgi:hypothetical protein